MTETEATYYFITSLDTDADYWCYRSFDEDCVLYADKTQAEKQCERYCTEHQERLRTSVQESNERLMAAWRRRRDEHQVLYVTGLRSKPFAEDSPRLQVFKEDRPRWPPYTVEMITLRFAEASP